MKESSGGKRRAYLRPEISGKRRAVLDGADLTPYSWLIFSGESVEEKKKESDRKILPLIVLIAALSVIGAFFMPGAENPSFERASAGGEDKTIDLIMEFEHGGAKVEKDVSLTVRAHEPTQAEAVKLLEEAERQIAKDISENGLSFPEHWGDCVSITWETEGFSYIGMEGSQERTFIAQLSCGEYSRLCEFNVMVTPSEARYIESLEQFAEDFTEKLSSSADGSALIIPEREDQVNISWKYPDTNGRPLVVCLGLFAALLLYFSRYDGLKKSFARRAEEFKAEVSNMSLQLILLLNCGLVAESAFSEIVKRNRLNPNPLYRAFSDIKARADSSNATFSLELYSYAKNTGDRDFIRFATLVAEHSERGSLLCDKLEQERNRLYQDRMGRAKAKAGQAETKLCFPLMLLLMILIVITVCPALMTM